MAVKLKCPKCSSFSNVRTDYRDWIKERLKSKDGMVTHNCKQCDHHFSGKIRDFLKIYPYQYDKNGC